MVVIMEIIDSIIISIIEKVDIIIKAITAMMDIIIRDFINITLDIISYMSLDIMDITIKIIIEIINDSQIEIRIVFNKNTMIILTAQG